MIPLMLDISSRRVLVIGSGAVGTRKAEYFKDHAKEVKIIDGIVDAQNNTTNSVRENIHKIIESYDIIIAATASKELNETICSCALEQKKLYNNATDIGNFLIPATFYCNGFTLAVSTDGRAPAAAAFIRDKIRESYPRISEMILLQELLRKELKRATPSQQQRAEILRKVLEDKSIWERLEDEEVRRSILDHDINKILEIVDLYIADTGTNNSNILEEGL